MSHSFTLIQGERKIADDKTNYDEPIEIHEEGDYTLVCECGFNQIMSAEMIWQARFPDIILREWVHRSREFKSTPSNTVSLSRQATSRMKTRR